MIVPLLDVVALAGFATALWLTVHLRPDVVDRHARLFLALGLFVYVFVSFSNVLQHSQITEYLDNFEDYAEVLFIPCFLIFVLTLQARRELHSREWAEAALRESERRFRELAKMLPETIFEIDLSGRLTFVNEHAYQQFGYGPEDMERGLQAMDFLVEQDRERGWKAVEQVFRGNPIKGNEYTAKRKDGSTFPVITFSAPMIREGRPVGLRGIMADMSHAKSLEVQLVQAQKMEAIGTLAGGVAHDFNNILQTISGHVELVLVGERLAPKDQERLLEISRACVRASELVKGLLTFSQKQQTTPRRVNLNREILNATALLKRTLPKGVRIRTELSPETAPILADPVGLEHILLNLASNANDAMGEEGIIEIRTENRTLSPGEAKARPGLDAGAHVLLVFSDNGDGMEPEVAENIFDPFFTTKEVGKGTGLGLSMVYGLVKEHRGHVRCASEPGAGTTFEIYFPAPPEAGQEQPPTD